MDWHASQATEVPVFKENCTVVTELLPNATFWTAEPKHQQYLEKLGFSSEKGDPEPINTKFKLDDEMVGAADFGRMRTMILRFRVQPNVWLGLQ